MISILIPAYNESERIADTIGAVRTLSAPDVPMEIVVVDDGSGDATAAVAERSGADVVFRQSNQGKGAALRQAMELAQGDILLLLDADLGSSAREASKLLAPILEGTADMTIATFPVLSGRGGGMGLVVQRARQGIQALTGRTMMAPLSGQRALRRNVITQIGGFAPGWGVEIALTVAAIRHGFRVVEVPTEMTHRVTGRDLSGILHRGRQWLAAVRVLNRLRAQFPGPPNSANR